MTLLNIHWRFVGDKRIVLRVGKKGVNLFKLLEWAGHNRKKNLNLGY